MSTTQIPPGTPAPPQTTQLLDGGDLYDAGRWELAYREMHDAPALMIQLQDDLSRSRQREAFWISVVVHLTVVILFVNSQKLESLYHRRPVVAISPNEMMRQKELTYLELPPDEQKLTKRPDTDKISDKDRIATSHSPQIDREELKKILDSARPGAPGPGGPPEQQQQQQQQLMAQSNPAPQSQQPAPSSAAPSVTQNQIARLQTPPAGKPNVSFGNPSMSPGSAIEQATRAAAANRGGYGGDGGDLGLGQGRQANAKMGELEVLNDTMGVDFGPYLSRVLHDVRENWYHVIPDSALSGFKKGKVSIQFAILKDGKVAGLTLVGSSGDVALDRAAIGGITGSNPFQPLPAQFPGQYLALRFHFYYNPDKSDMQ